jgi:hypothetical protein
MTLSFNKLNEIAALYESIAASEQEQLNESYLEELTVAQKDTKIKSELNTANSEMIRRGGVAGSISRGLTSMFGTQKDIDKNKASDKASDARVRQSGAASVGKYYSSSDNKTYANYNDAKAARNSRLKDLAAKQPAAKPAPAPATKPAPAPAPATKPAPAAGSPKVLPTKPAAPAKPAMGTTAGGTKFERRAATGAELAAARAARDAAKASGNTKGAEEAAVKAGVNASKPSTLAAATTAASKPAAFKPATINAASSTSASASGDTYKYKPNSSLMKNSFEYDAYDLVLEYLLSQGHADTVAEAHYLMTEMDAEMIGDIVEGSISSRASNAVGHQRAGTLGDDDEIRKNQDATSASIGKMKRGSGAKVTPTLPGV